MDDGLSRHVVCIVFDFIFNLIVDVCFYLLLGATTQGEVWKTTFDDEKCLYNLQKMVILIVGYIPQSRIYFL